MVLQSTSSRSERIFGLDLLRALAILAVLGSHILYIFPGQSGGIISMLHLGGVMGVELFFVLSGYLIGRILLRIFTKQDFRVSDLKYFLIRRWFRTLPNYYLILILNVILVILIGRELPESLPLYFGFLQNLFDGMDLFFTESWSLPVEEFAYVLGPLVIYLFVIAFAKAKKEILFLWATLSIIGFFIGTKVYYHITVPTTSLEQWNIDLKAVVFYRIDAIYYGVLAAYLSVKFENIWNQSRMVLAFMGFILFWGFQIVLGKFRLDAMSAPLIWNVLYLPISSIAFCLFLPLFSTWKKAPIFISKPIKTLSIISYAVYLLHYSLLLQIMRWLWPIEGMTFRERIGYSIVYFMSLMVVSWIWYRLYEKPMTDLRDKPFITKYFKH